MADNTKIEWTDATWNVVNGCSLASPGCTNCYAMKLAGTRMKNHPTRAGLTQDTKTGPVWTGEVRFNEAVLTQPLRWKRPRRIFVCAHGDLFHENVPDEWIDQVFAVMALAPQHTFQVLTKRSDRMREYIARRGASPSLPSHEIMAAMDGISRDKWPDLRWPLSNVWLGVSVEDQARADQRIPDLLATPAAVRWLSCEPLLGPVDLRWIAEPDDEKDGAIDALLGCNWIDNSHTNRGEVFRPVRPGHEDRLMRRWVCSSEADILAGRKIDWVVVGGESGPGARPMHPDWARSLRDQCQAAGVAFHFKQWGDWFPYGEIDAEGHHNSRTKGEKTGDWFEWRPPVNGFSVRIGKKQAGRLLDGREWSEYPA